MNHSRFLKIALPVIAVPALVILILPSEVWPTYVDVVEPVALLAGSFMALWVSFSYRKELKAAFIFLSVFLLIYALAIVLLLSFSPLLLPSLESRLGREEIISLVQAIQFINYAVLFFFCINILRVVKITRLNRRGWFLFVFTLIYTIIAAVYPVLVEGVATFGVPTIVMRILDAALIIVMVPVLWLYIQYLAAQQRQSLTFTVVIFGIVCSTIFDYLFQLIIAIFPRLLPEGSSFYATIPEALFVYGYLIIAVGLYAHRKGDEWGYQAVDKAMSEGFELAGLPEER